MGKITNEMAKDAAESVMCMLSMFQTGFKTLCEENEELTMLEKIALTDTWWRGQMYMFTHVGKSDDDMGLL